jgi:hypothetical protein
LFKALVFQRCPRGCNGLIIQVLFGSALVRMLLIAYSFRCDAELCVARVLTQRIGRLGRNPMCLGMVIQ